MLLYGKFHMADCGEREWCKLQGNTKSIVYWPPIVFLTCNDGARLFPSYLYYTGTAVMALYWYIHTLYYTGGPFSSHYVLLYWLYTGTSYTHLILPLHTLALTPPLLRSRVFRKRIHRPAHRPFLYDLPWMQRGKTRCVAYGECQPISQGKSRLVGA